MSSHCAIHLKFMNVKSPTTSLPRKTKNQCGSQKAQRTQPENSLHCCPPCKYWGSDSTGGSLRPGLMGLTSDVPYHPLGAWFSCGLSHKITFKHPEEITEHLN